MKNVPTINASRFFLGFLVLAALLVAIPGSVEHARGASDSKLFRFALLAPRSPMMESQARRWSRRVFKATKGQLRVVMFWGGVAGEDRAVLNKMRSGQIDASVVQTVSLSSYVPEAQILSVPGLYNNYRQFDAVIKELEPSFDALAYKNGYKVMGWGDIGMLRIFSRSPIRDLQELRRMRLWLWSEATMMERFYKLLGVVGVPLGINEVITGLQTRMIDVVIGSALAASAMLWTKTTPYVSQQGAGYLSGAMVISRRRWDAMPPSVSNALLELSKRYKSDMIAELRKGDAVAYKQLMKRGIKAVRIEDQPKWEAVFKKLRNYFVGRLYTRETLDKVEKICAQHK